MSGTDAARGVLQNAVRARVFPAAVADVGNGSAPMWTEAFGTLTFDASSPAVVHDTPFDLASLTKVIATTTMAMELVRADALRLDERVSVFFPEWRGEDREGVTVADLLEHPSALRAGLVAAPPVGRREFEHDICTIRLECEPRAASIYGDLGFILLGFLLADRGRASLASQFDAVWVRLKPDTTGDQPKLGTAGDQRDLLTSGDQPDLLTFHLDPALRRLAAPTLPLADDPRRGRRLMGEVHDNYAAALGGVAGHAGLFGTASAVGAFARAMLGALRGDRTAAALWPPELVSRFTARSSVAGSSRALGWDTMLPTSSCGTGMSRSAIGHAGFTGTSLWIDPERDRYFVLLTNRVCGGGTLDAMRDVRRTFHDALAAL